MDKIILTASTLNIIKTNGCCHTVAQKTPNHHSDVELLQYRTLVKGVEANYKVVKFSIIKTIK